MFKFKAKQILDGVPEDVRANLVCGRITNVALLIALNRCLKHPEFSVDDLETKRVTTYSHILLADELNDMLEAAKRLREI